MMESPVGGDGQERNGEKRNRRRKGDGRGGEIGIRESEHSPPPCLIKSCMVDLSSPIRCSRVQRAWVLHQSKNWSSRGEYVPMA